MKRFFTLTLLLLIILPIKSYSQELTKDAVTLSNCVDGDSARFMLGVEEINVKFLGIESDEKIKDDETDEINESYVSNYVCESLKSAKKIEIQYEPNIEIEDKFGRIQAWVVVDDVLLQEDLVKNGYARIMYIKDEYTYAEDLKKAQEYAKLNKLGIWKDEIVDTASDEKDNEEKETKKEKDKGIIGIIIDFIVDIFNKIIKFIDDLINNIL